MKRVLVTGALGQVGTELTPKLRERYGMENVLATDIREPMGEARLGPFELLDVTDLRRVREVIKEYEIDFIFHLAAVLSAAGEMRPQLAWRVNIEGLRNILEAAREFNVERVFFPSSIASFGPETPREMAPQDTIMRPKTMYGITKLAGELLCDYYYYKYGVDVRGVRYPGIISSEALPGGGTTDYAVEMFHYAVKEGHYVCFVRRETVLPMIYMPDAIRAAIELMEVDISRLKHHNAFNVSGMSFSAGELEEEIRRHIPHFTVEYRPDFRQEIAETWPRSIDDSAAREEWGWRPLYNLSLMVEDMIMRLKKKYEKGLLS
ncbi:NAD-dependent epimerase/dehydratase family protein [Candidatus Bathyarchaeota archaeon]|nr:NAD-dependent epimerase/dehydratase family protein [Candidatus Bathyarchaeota archaeon]